MQLIATDLMTDNAAYRLRCWRIHDSYFHRSGRHKHHENNHYEKLDQLCNSKRLRNNP